MTQALVKRFHSSPEIRRRLAKWLCSASLLASALACGAQPQIDLAQLDLTKLDRARVLRAAQADLGQAPQTVTAFPAPRSSGGPHDFYSEGDYWWPDPAHPGGPYIQRDGLSNPDNFVAHRRALIRFAVQVPELVAAWKITGDQRYARHAAAHLRAWFVEPSTRLNPKLEYAQAIFGRSKGRGIGIIDTVHLVEVARAIEVLEAGGALPARSRHGSRPTSTGWSTAPTASRSATPATTTAAAGCCRWPHSPI
jgi:hypothetical protein